MSISANGIVFHATDVFELHEQITRWKEQVATLTKAAYATLYADHIIKKIDDAAADDQPIPGRTFSDARHYVREQQDEIKKTQIRNPRYDFEFLITIHPYDGRLYALIACEQRSWRVAFDALGLGDDMSYDSRVDGGDIPEEEWERRAVIWAGISAKFQFGDGAGLTFDCSAQSHRVQPTVEEVICAMPTLKERAHRVAEERVYVRFIENDEKFQIAKAEADATGGVPSHAMMGVWRRFKDWAKTETGQCMIALEAGHVYSLLPTITKDLL